MYECEVRKEDYKTNLSYPNDICAHYLKRDSLFSTIHGTFLYITMLGGTAVALTKVFKASAFNAIISTGSFVVVA